MTGSARVGWCRRPGWGGRGMCGRGFWEEDFLVVLSGGCVESQGRGFSRSSVRDMSFYCPAVGAAGEPLKKLIQIHDGPPEKHWVRNWSHIYRTCAYQRNKRGPEKARENKD